MRKKDIWVKIFGGFKISTPLQINAPLSNKRPPLGPLEINKRPGRLLEALK